MRLLAVHCCGCAKHRCGSARVNCSGWTHKYHLAWRQCHSLSELQCRLVHRIGPGLMVRAAAALRLHSALPHFDQQPCASEFSKMSLCCTVERFVTRFYVAQLQFGSCTSTAFQRGRNKETQRKTMCTGFASVIQHACDAVVTAVIVVGCYACQPRVNASLRAFML